MRKRYILLYVFLFSLLIISSKNLGNFDSLPKDFEPLYSFKPNLEIINENIRLESPMNNSVLPSGTPIYLDITDFNLSLVLFNWDAKFNNSWLQPYETDLPMGDGLHILHVYALDLLDNWEYKQYHFMTDDTPPFITLRSVNNGSVMIPRSLIELNIDDPHLQRIQYHWDSANNLTLESPYRVFLPSEEGVHFLTVYAYDIVGNLAIESFMFTTQGEVYEDSDNDGLADYYEFLLGTDMTEFTDILFGAPLNFDDLIEDRPDTLYDAFQFHNHITSNTWVIGDVSENILGDNSDFYLFSSEIRTMCTVFLQSNHPNVIFNLFDLENRLNLTGQIPSTSIQTNNDKIKAKLHTTTQYNPNALPYYIEIPIPLAVEFLVIQIESGNIEDIFYSIWIEEIPLSLQPQLFTLLINILLFLILPLGFFFVLRWENHRLTKHQQSDELEIKSEVILNASFKEWVFSSIILLIMVFLFSELSREKFLNRVSVLTAKSFVDLGYRILLLALSLILLGIFLSIFYWIRNFLGRARYSDLQGSSWTKGLLIRIIKMVLVLSIYFILWLAFLRVIVIIRSEVSAASILNDVVELFKVFFANDLSSPPSQEQRSLLIKLGILDLVFAFLAVPLGLYMFTLNFSGGISIRHIFRSSNGKKNKFNFKSILLSLSLGIELYRVFSNLFNYLIAIAISENYTLFFIELSELPWWHQIVTWISQESLISTPVLYGLYFELQGIFFAWVIYTSLPTFLRRLMSGSTYSKMIIRIGIFLLGMFVIFLRTLHLLLLIPIGVSGFPLSTILSEPFSIMILLAMISELLEIIGFSLGLLIVVYYRKFHKRVKREIITPPIVDDLIIQRFEEE
jgi:hypothetical protein